MHLVDVVLRRTNLAFVGGVTTELLTELASILQAPLGWTDAERDAEIDDTKSILRTLHGVEVVSKNSSSTTEAAAAPTKAESAVTAAAESRGTPSGGQSSQTARQVLVQVRAARRRARRPQR